MHPIIRPLLATCVTVGFAVAAHGADYIWCTVQDNTNSTAYVSDVFEGNYSDHVAMENSFTDAVHAQNSSAIGMASCFYENDVHAARDGRNSDIAQFKQLYHDVETVSWTY